MTICPPATTVTRDTTAHKEECMKMNACIVNWMTNQCPINLFVSIGYWEVFLIFPTIFPKSEAASCPALSTANFWETKKVSAREKTKQPIADSVPMCFCSTNWN